MTPVMSLRKYTYNAVTQGLCGPGGTRSQQSMFNEALDVS